MSRGLVIFRHFPVILISLRGRGHLMVGLAALVASEVQAWAIHSSLKAKGKDILSVMIIRFE